ncbi:MAG: SCO4226 family nickel-binding protein [Myxococcales bacterium]
MATFIDIHSGMTGLTREQLEAAHRQDQQFQAEEGVTFLKAWAAPQDGKVFCLAEAPSKEAIQRVHARAGHGPDEIYEVPLTVE